MLSRNLSPAAWRKTRELTLEAAARLVGIRGKNPARTWQRWETGEREPPLRVVQAVAFMSEGAVTPASWLAEQHKREGRRDLLRAA